MNKLLRSILLLIFFGIFLYAGYQVITISMDYRKSEAAYEAMTGDYVSVQTGPAAAGSSVTAPGGTVTVPAAVPSVDGLTTYRLPPVPNAPEDRLAEEITIDFPALKAVNGDITAWLYSPDTVISYPVLQSHDNVDYLRHLPDGSYNGGGSLFIDYRCSGFDGLNTLVYGHNRKDGSMFRSLLEYKKQSYFEEHPQLYLFMENGAFVLRPVAGFVTPSDSDSYTFYNTEESLRSYLQRCVEKSTFVSGADISGIDRIITLSTCDYTYDEARYVLICQPVPIES